MNMIEKILILMEERGYTKADVAKGADMPYTTLDGLFKKGFENTRFPTLKKLATFFDVSMEYLVNDEESDRDYGKLMPSNLTRDDYHLIKLWNKLPHDEKMKILGRIELILEGKE